MNKFIIFFCTFSALFFLMLSNVYSHEYHHVEPDYQLPTNNYQIDSKGVALAAASGQHNYKATTSLQWSVAGAFVNENDDSAVSFGLSKQIGKIFGSINFSSDGHSSIIGVSASGTF